MKKILNKILILIIMMCFGYQKYCYADVVDITEDGILMLPFAFMGGLIAVIVLIVSSISFLTLKSISKEKEEKIKEENLRLTKNIMYICSIIIAMAVHIFSWYHFKFLNIWLWIVIIGFVISMILRLIKKNKISNIVCVLSIIFVCIVAIFSQIRDNYNNQFLQYVEGYSFYPSYSEYVSDVEGLIKTAISNNNKSKRKITIIYQETSYISVDELNNLLNEINTKQHYFITTNYDKNNDYLESITLNRYIIENIENLLTYEGTHSGTKVKGLINTAIYKVYSVEESVNINIIYNSDINQTKTIHVSEENSEQLSDLKNEIVTSKTYTVEIICKYNICDIVITSNK